MCEVVKHQAASDLPTPRKSELQVFCTAAAQEAVFAGRRSTDKLYLALQNAYCAQALHGYAGTSSVYALEILDGVLGRQGIDEQRR